MERMVLHPEAGCVRVVDCVRVLTLTQPWAWVVVHGGKDVENRRWNTKYRGPVLIQASESMSRLQYEEAREFCERVWDEEGIDPDIMPPHDSPRLARGAIVGRAWITGVVPPHEGAGGGYRPWHMREQFGFLLAGVEAVEETPWKGGLGLRRTPLDQMERLMPGTREWAERGAPYKGGMTHPKPFPLPPTPEFLREHGAALDLDLGLVEVPTATSCKHGRGGCEECGTTDRRDARHATKGGRGVVARLMGKRVKRR